MHQIVDIFLSWSDFEGLFKKMSTFYDIQEEGCSNQDQPLRLLFALPDIRMIFNQLF